ncbi:MAG TPA: Ig-like domain-containing protein [Denitromonas sp.]|nr:Ig-like domain-containing protein [Denitromonas sp.]
MASSLPTSGTVAFIGDSFVYTPFPDVNGADSFSFFVDDGEFGYFRQDVTVTINPVNDDPVAGDDAAATDQDLPVDPSGVIYDSATGAALPGATVTLTTAAGTPLPDACVLPNQQGQVTGDDGYYRFDLVVGAAPQCPAGETEYRIVVTAPDGYLPPPSTSIPPQPGTMPSITSGKASRVPGSSTAMR